MTYEQERMKRKGGKSFSIQGKVHHSMKKVSEACHWMKIGTSLLLWIRVESTLKYDKDRTSTDERKMKNGFYIVCSLLPLTERGCSPNFEASNALVRCVVYPSLDISIRRGVVSFEQKEMQMTK